MSLSQEPQQSTERDEESSQRTVVQAESNRPQTPRFNMERPKLPTFSGDIREYNVFKADFQHVIHPHYGGRDALMILRSCLKGKPLQHIRRIGRDYEAARGQLDKSRSAVKQVTTVEERQQDYRCWIYKSKDGHWPDQCKTFLHKSPAERLALVKSSRACYSCLKQAGREHRMATCKKRRRCPETYKGQPSIIHCYIPVWTTIQWE